MKKHQASMISDVTFIIFILTCVVTMIFISSNPTIYTFNMVFLNVCFLIAIITYFTNIITGLILNLLFIFGYGSFTLYQTAISGQMVGMQNYFWLILTPIFSVLVWFLTYNNRRLQVENENLNSLKNRLVTIDEQTNLKNTLSFQQDVKTFMALSVRYKIPLTLLVINVKYWQDIKRFIPPEKLNEALSELSDMGQSLVRTNDTLYLLDSEYPTWGIVLFTDSEGSKIVVNRFKDTLNKLNKTAFSEKYSVDLEFVIGAIQYDEVVSPLEWIAQARKTLEYDV